MQKLNKKKINGKRALRKQKNDNNEHEKLLHFSLKLMNMMMIEIDEKKLYN